MGANGHGPHRNSSLKHLASRMQLSCGAAVGVRDGLVVSVTGTIVGMSEGRYVGIGVSVGVGLVGLGELGEAVGTAVSFGNVRILSHADRVCTAGRIPSVLHVIGTRRARKLEGAPCARRSAAGSSCMSAGGLFEPAS